MRAANHRRRLLVQPHALLQAADVASVQLDSNVQLVAHLPRHRHAAAQHAQLQSLVAQGVSQLAVYFGVVRCRFGRPPAVVHRLVELARRVIDGAHPHQGVGVFRIAAQPLLRHPIQGVEALLFEERLAVGGKTERCGRGQQKASE